MKHGITIFILCAFVTLTACDEEETTSKKEEPTKDNSTEIAKCKKMSDAFEDCIGWSEMGTTLIDAKAECDKADFDSYDSCMFDCEGQSIDCEVLTTCFDEC